MQGSITELVAGGGPVLADGGIETRVMFRPDVSMDPDVQVAAMVDDPDAGPVLREVYASYVAAGRARGVPVVVGTPTFRASARYAQQAGLGDDAVERLNRAAVDFNRGLRDGVAGDSTVWIAGVLGPAGDAYQADEALGVDEAREYHTRQAAALAGAGVDFLFAATFPAVDEAAGVALAMADTGLPSVVSFVLDADGRLLDGCRLAEAVDRVDQAAAPSWLSLSCVYPAVAHRALEAAGIGADASVDRIREVKANGSSLTPAELVGLDHPVADPPEEWAEAMWRLRRDFGVAVLGGCCGTDERHIDALARRMAAGQPVPPQSGAR